VAAYAPVMPILASIFGTFILGESLFLGCVIGTTLILSGLFFVTWGQNVERRQKALSIGPTIPMFRALETPLLK
jgi:drug/metabolite transporter (DMT)-like permease